MGSGQRTDLAEVDYVTVPAHRSNFPGIGARRIDVRLWRQKWIRALCQLVLVHVAIYLTKTPRTSEIRQTLRISIIITQITPLLAHTRIGPIIGMPHEPFLAANLNRRQWEMAPTTHIPPYLLGVQERYWSVGCFLILYGAIYRWRDQVEDGTPILFGGGALFCVSSGF